MIRSMAQAVQVQARRASSGRLGYAKAVRRFLRRTEAPRYGQARARLPVEWMRPNA